MFSVTLRQSGFKRKEYPNMAKRLSSSQREIIIRNDENFKKKKSFIENLKLLNQSKVYAKRVSGPGIKKTNQDNFFILIILIIIQIIFTWVCVMGMEFLVKI